MDRLLSGGLQPVRTVLRALALRQLDPGQSTPAAAVSLGLSAKAVWQIGKRYQQGGLERALYDASRPGAAPALDEEQRQRIIAVACSQPPSGRARWTAPANPDLESSYESRPGYRPVEVHTQAGPTQASLHNQAVETLVEGEKMTATLNHRILSYLLSILLVFAITPAP